MNGNFQSLEVSNCTFHENYSTLNSIGGSNGKIGSSVEGIVGGGAILFSPSLQSTKVVVVHGC